MQNGRSGFQKVIKKRGRRACSLLLVTAMCAGCIPAAAFAQEPEVSDIPKEEVVYATLEPTGSVKDIFVVNVFTSTDGETIEDHGQYSEVKNLTSLAPIGYEDDTVTADIPKGRFYYQGNMKEKELPWKIDITYELDGKEKSASQMSGADGKVKIKIHTSQNQKTDPLFYEKYMLQISVTLDTEVCEHIRTKDATVANAGTDKMFNYAVMPAKDSEIVITADAKNFGMKGITFAGVPFSMSDDMIDMSQIHDMAGGLSLLADGISQLNSGAGELDSGLREFSSGTGQLRDGFELFSSGLYQLSEGTGMLHGGAQALEDGSSQFNTGLQQLAAGSDQLSVGSAQINDVFQTLKKKTDEFVNLDDKFVAKMIEDMNQLYDWLVCAKEQLDSILEEVEIKELETPFQQISVEELVKAKEELKVQADAGVISQETVNVFDRLVNDYYLAALVQQLIDDNEKIQNWVDDTLAGIEKFIDALKNVEITKPEEILKLAEAVGMFADQYQMFHDGLTAYTGGVKQLAGGYQEIHGGIEGITDGISGISDAAQMTAQGSTQMLDGIRGIDSGAGALSGGMGQLAEGISLLNSQTSALPSQVKDGIDKLLGEFMNTDFTPVSFTSEENKNVAAVQFVFASEEIEKNADVAEKAGKTEEKSFWEKFLDLFR